MTTDIATEIDDLQTMTTGELADRYEELHGQPCRTRHRAYLIRKIAWRIQANAEGDLSERARKRAAELANDAEVRVTAPKTMICPPGSNPRATYASDDRARRPPQRPTAALTRVRHRPSVQGQDHPSGRARGWQGV